MKMYLVAFFSIVAALCLPLLAWSWLPFVIKFGVDMAVYSHPFWGALFGNFFQWVIFEIVVFIFMIVSARLVVHFAEKKEKK